MIYKAKALAIESENPIIFNEWSIANQDVNCFDSNSVLKAGKIQQFLVDCQKSIISA